MPLVRTSDACDQDGAAHPGGDAAARLRRQFGRATQEVTPLREWPAVNSAYILCAEDRMVSTTYSRHASNDVLGIEPLEMPGGHSPFLSRPRELAGILVGLVSG